MSTIIHECEDKMKKSVKNMDEEFNTIRTGRASTALFDKIRVDYFGTATPLNQVATVSVPEARLVVIQPWDKTLIGEIEKALQKSELSINPSNDGKVIRIAIPPLTEERRKELVKLAKQIAEQCRVAIRNIRRDANEDFKKQKAVSEISEDEEKRLSDEVQKLTDHYVADVSLHFDAKEKEIMEV